MSASEPASDLTTIVEYRTDRWLMDHIPWALWTSLLGLAVVLYTEGAHAKDAALAVVYLALLALAFAGWVAASVIEDRSGLPVIVTLPIGVVIFILVAAIIGVVAGSTGDPQGATGRGRWSSLVDPPITVFGWMMIEAGIGWIAFAVFRHVRPGRPIVMLSPDGLSLHRFWLRNVFIPWREVQGVGPVRIENSGGGRPHVDKNAIGVSVSPAFFASRVRPRLTQLAPPYSEFMFREIDRVVQVVLAARDLTVAPKDFLEPIEARWKAFRDRAEPTAGSSAPPLAHGRWEPEVSAWQVARHLLPILCMIAVAFHAASLRR